VRLLFYACLTSASLLASQTHAALVTGFKLPSTTNVISDIGGVEVRTGQAITTNGLSSFSAGSLVAVENKNPLPEGLVETFTGSFAISSPIDLMFFDFAAKPFQPGSTVRYEVDVVAGGQAFAETGSFTTSSGAITSLFFDVSDLTGVSFGEATVTLIDGEFTEVPTLPQTGYNGFAAISSGVSTPPVPEPSSALLIASLGAIAGLRRRRNAKRCTSD
jgi:hypothetical protein